MIQSFFAKAIKAASKASFYMWDILHPEESTDNSDVEAPVEIEA